MEIHETVDLAVSNPSLSQDLNLDGIGKLSNPEPQRVEIGHGLNFGLILTSDNHRSFFGVQKEQKCSSLSST